MKMKCFIKEAIEKNGYALGAFVASGSAMNCECLGINGMDFVIIDAEHAQTGAETMVDMSRASELYEMSAIVRVYNPDDYTMMSRMLDVGMHGIMVPMVEDASQAEKIIRYIKYPPLGMRGVNGGRGPRWGMIENYPEQANDKLFTAMQIESRKGVENVEQIARVKGVDCLFIGTGDLTQDYGCSGENDNPIIVDAIDRVLSACKKNDIIPGIVSGGSEDVLRRLVQGFSFVTCMNDQVFFRVESGKRIHAIRNGIK